ncbi:hypothetical protein [Natrinema salinisoli]|uniref:hypothetical protein n=1 Tax=Natrinema salinisoli TaxID=2878535 RepID=UPI001CF060FA|nr:hypothetical protein [Natrinema salinisoli]
MTLPRFDRDDGSPTQRKATLFCWECDHSSAIDGDWAVQRAERYVAYNCPICETTLAKRPRNEPSPARVTGKPLAAWPRALRRSATIWRASVALGLSSLALLTGTRPTTER